jgi:hypothetical protein
MIVIPASFYLNGLTIDGYGSCQEKGTVTGDDDARVVAAALRNEFGVGGSHNGFLS